MQTKMNQSTGIHCKVVCNDQIRRFQFSGTEFCSLHHQVKQLLALDREFVLKYKDNEDDMITISCTEELTCAVDSNVSQKDESGFLRLTVFFPEPSINTTEQNQHGPDNCHREHGRDFCHRGYGHGFGHHGHGFGHHEHGHGFGHHGHGFGHHEHGHGFGHHGHGFGHHEHGHGFGHHEHGHGFGHHGHGFGHHEHGHGFGHHGHGFGHHGHGFGHHEHGHGFGHHGYGHGFCHRGLGLDIEHQGLEQNFCHRERGLDFCPRGFGHHGHGFGHHEHGHGFGHHGHGFGHHEHGHGFGHHGHGKDFGHHEHGCMRGRWGGGRWCHEGGLTSSEFPCHKNRFERCRDKLTLKRDMFKAYLNSLEARELTPEEERRKLMFQERVQRLELFLTKFPPKDEANICPEKEELVKICPPMDKCYHKFEKKARKCERREHKEGKRREAKNSYLSEEAKAEISTLKSKIRELKPTLWALQEQLKVKKSALRAASDAGQQAKISELKIEVQKLKQEKWDKKGQIKPLCQRLHQLKSGK